MKSILTMLCAFLLMTTIVLVIGTFSQGSFDISHWSSDARDFACIILVFSAVGILVGRLFGYFKVF